MSSQQSQRRSSTRALMKQSFIQQDQSPLPIRILKKIDIFSFIPVPKDDPVSTKQSLIGSTVFFIIFMAYVIFDFYQFVTENPPNAQNYYTNLQDRSQTLPRFAITFMSGDRLNVSNDWNEYIRFGLTQEWKDRGQQLKPPVRMDVNNFTKENTVTNNNTIDWIDQKTKEFYNILRTSSQDLTARGLLYSTANASYSKIKIQICNYAKQPENCMSEQEIKKFCAGGRVFLFIENILDTTDFANQDETNSPRFFIYNFFLEPYMYKRVTFNFQIVETVVEPDYFFRIKTQRQTRLEISSYIEQTSNVAPILNGSLPLDMLGIQFQLAPQILNVRVTYRTLIDHISMWGAFWGVLFALFAILFLSYNRKKFYKKNPEWDKFKQNNNNLAVNDEDLVDENYQKQG